MRRVKSLHKGDCIGLVAPSGPITNQNVLNGAIKKLEEMGYKVKEASNLRKIYGYLAGTDEERIKGIESMFSDDTVDAIFCVKGGYGVPRIIQDINIDMIKQNPKIFAGFSDITLLHILFNQQADFMTFHGPMISSSCDKPISEFTSNSFFSNIQAIASLGEIKNPVEYPRQCITKGTAEGQLIGGNLSLVVKTLGTKNEIDTKGKILFLEDVAEEPYKIDGMLNHLKNAGKFSNCAGIVFGDWADSSPKTNQSLSLDQVIEDVIAPLGVPTLAGIRAGHCEPTLTLVMGAMHRIDAEALKFEALENACV